MDICKEETGKEGTLDEEEEGEGGEGGEEDRECGWIGAEVINKEGQEFERVMVFEFEFAFVRCLLGL